MWPRRLSLIKNNWLSVIQAMGTDGRRLHEWSWVRNAIHGHLSVSHSWPFDSVQDGQTKLFTAAAFLDQTQILLENTSMFKNRPLNVLVSGASVRSNFRGELLSPLSKTTAECTIWILQDTSWCSSIAPLENGLTSSTSLKERARERGIVQHVIFWKDESWFSVHVPSANFFFSFWSCCLL